MKILLEHPKRLHGKRGHRILKRMARLARELDGYHLDESAEESCSSAGSAVRSRSRRRRRGHGRCSSSSSDSESCSGTSTSSSSDDSRSPSPAHRHPHRRRRGPPGQPSRSKSFAGRGCGSPPPRGPEHHRHQHRHPHHRDHRRRGHWRRRLEHGHRDGICGLLYRSFAQSEPNLLEAEAAANGGQSRGEEVVRGPEVDGTNAEEAGQEGNTDTSVEMNPELIEELSKKMRGLQAEPKKLLMRKYLVSNCPQLRGPKLNQEFLPVASEAAVERDVALMREQSQVGAGLTALAWASNDLNKKAEAENNLEMIPILDAMDDAAAIIADVHRNITQMRQAFLAAELNKRVRPVVDACQADELLFGKDFRDKVKDVRAFSKGKKGCEKKEKRRHVDQGGEKRKSKRLHRHGIVL